MDSFQAKRGLPRVSPPAKKSVPDNVTIKVGYDPRQSTLTQIYILGTDKESSSEEVLTPMKAIKKTRNATTQCRVTLLSSPDYQGKLFEIGDLVMSTADDINHPALDDNLIAPAFIFLGCITGFRTRKWANGKIVDYEHPIVNWMNIDIGGNCYQDYKDRNPWFDDDCCCFNVFVSYDFINKNKLKLIAGMASTKVDLHNNFIQELIYDNFCHGSERGWSKILPVV